jgi:hypothetical protein
MKVRRQHVRLFLLLFSLPLTLSAPAVILRIGVLRHAQAPAYKTIVNTLYRARGLGRPRNSRSQPFAGYEGPAS